MSLRVRRRRTQPDQRTNSPNKLIPFGTAKKKKKKKTQASGEIKTTRLEFSLTKDRQSASAAARGAVNELELYVTMHRRTPLTKRRLFSLNMPLRSQCLFRSMKYEQVCLVQSSLMTERRKCTANCRSHKSVSKHLR